MPELVLAQLSSFLTLLVRKNFDPQ